MTFKHVDLEIQAVLFYWTVGVVVVIEYNTCDLKIKCVNTFEYVSNNLLGKLWGMPNGIY